MRPKPLNQKLIFRILFLVNIVLLWNCDSNLESTIESTDAFKTVNIEYVKRITKDLISKEDTNRGEEGIIINPDWTTLGQDEIEGTDALLTNVEAEVTSLESDNLYVRLIFIEYQETIYQSIETAEVFDYDEYGNILNGKVYYHGFGGTYIDGYIIENGMINKRMLKSQESETEDSHINTDRYNDEKTEDCDEDLVTNSTFCDETLDEIIIGGESAGVGIIHIFLNNNQNEPELVDPGEGVSSEIPNEGGNGNPDDDPQVTCSGIKVNDGNGNCVCPSGYSEDADGVCQEKPCSGDPVKNPEIAPQKGSSGSTGALFGNSANGNCTRYGGSDCATPRNKEHNGIDIKSEYGNPIYAMYDGFIYSSKYQKNKAGYNTRIQSTINGQTILISYFHLQKDNRVEQGTPGSPLVYVQAGDIIGYQGDSGNLKNAIANGGVDSHVHIEVREHDGSNSWGYSHFTVVDPRNYLSTTIDDNGITQSNTDCNEY